MANIERPNSSQPSELEGGDTEQNWGQGEGAQEPTIPDPSDEEEQPQQEQPPQEQPPPTYTGGTATALDDPDLPLAREDEAMDR